MASDLTPDPTKKLEPRGNLPERSVSAPRMLWWVLALVAILLFCLLAWLLHNGGLNGAGPAAG